MATTVSDESFLEYDMLQLVDGDDSVSSIYLDTLASPLTSSTSQNEDMLANCRVDVSNSATVASVNFVTEYTPSYPSSFSTPNAAAAAGSSSSLTTMASSFPDPSINFQDEIAACFLENDQLFLRNIEQMVQIEIDTDTKKVPNETGRGRKDSTVSLDTLMHMMPSPCMSVPNTCHSPLDECVTDVDECEVECPQFIEKRKKKEVEEQTKKYAGGLMERGLFSMSSPPIESSLIDMSKASSLEHIDNNVSASRLSLMAEETLNNLKIDGEDEEMDDEAMQDEIDLLEKEAKYLDAHVTFLQFRAKLGRQQRKRSNPRCLRDAKLLKRLAKIEEDNEVLHKLVAQQKVYQENFQAMLSVAPINNVRMTLMTPLESYIRLGKDVNKRREMILSIREEKLDMTYKFIEQKAAGLDCSKPYQYLDTFEKFGKQYSVSFVISKHEGMGICQVGWGIYEQVAGRNKMFNKEMGNTTIHELFDWIDCNFVHQRVVLSLDSKEEDTRKTPDVESNSVYYCRFNDDLAVLTTDYINQDDLHPYDTSNYIRRDVSSGAVLSNHIDANGKSFVLMKYFVVVKCHIYPHKVSQDQQARIFATIPNCHDSVTRLVGCCMQPSTTDHCYAGED